MNEGRRGDWIDAGGEDESATGNFWGDALELKRLFELQIHLEPYNEAVLSVLNSIEAPVLTFDSSDEIALEDIADSDGLLSSSAHAKHPEVIRNWLGLGCQLIRLSGPEDEKLWEKCPSGTAVFISNAAEALFPIGDVPMPGGPAMFFGQIVVRKVPENRDALKFMIAHELVHVFSLLRFLIPAYKNWPLCWENLLNAGSYCDNARAVFHTENHFLDDYGRENELVMVQNYWPTRARAWFEAFLGKVPKG